MPAPARPILTGQHVEVTRGRRRGTAGVITRIERNGARRANGLRRRQYQVVTQDGRPVGWYYRDAIRPVGIAVDAEAAPDPSTPRDPEAISTLVP